MPLSEGMAGFSLWPGCRIGGEHHLTARKAVRLRLGGEACAFGKLQDVGFGHVPGKAVGMGDDAILLAVGA